MRYLRSVPSLTRQRNLGIDDASGEVVVFLDDDVTIEPDLFAPAGRGLCATRASSERPDA